MTTALGPVQQHTARVTDLTTATESHLTRLGSSPGAITAAYGVFSFPNSLITARLAAFRVFCFRFIPQVRAFLAQHGSAILVGISNRCFMLPIRPADERSWNVLRNPVTDARGPRSADRAAPANARCAHSGCEAAGQSLPAALTVVGFDKFILATNFAGFLLLGHFSPRATRTSELKCPRNPGNSTFQPRRGSRFDKATRLMRIQPPDTVSDVGEPGPTGQPSINQTTNMIDQPIRKVIE